MMVSQTCTIKSIWGFVEKTAPKNTAFLDKTKTTLLFSHTRSVINFPLTSVQKAAQAVQNGAFANEIIGVPVKDKKGAVTNLVVDEEVAKVNFDKLPTLKPAFSANGKRYTRSNITPGTITAANASKLNDGASALVLASEAYATERKFKPIAKILGTLYGSELISRFCGCSM